MVLAAAGLKAGQEDYWIRQIAESRCEYLSGHGETPGQWYGARAAALGLSGVAKDEQCRAMFAGKDPVTGEQVAQPKWVADPRSKLPAGPLAERLRALADERSIGVEALARSQALVGDVRAVLGRREVKAETVERVSRHVLKCDPQEIYGDAYAEAAKHAGRRVDDRDAWFDLCFSDVKSGSLFYAGADEAARREYVAARQEAIRGALGLLEQHAVGVRRGHGGTEHLDGRGLLAIGYDHRTSREGDPQLHTHMLVQNLPEGPDGRATALDSKRLWAHLMTAERVYQQLWRAELSQRLGLEFVEVPDHEQLEIKGWDDKPLRDWFSKRAAQVRAQCDAWGTSDTRTAREAARATRRAKDHSETEEVIYDRWRAELAEHGISERTYADRLGRATGRTLTGDQTAALLVDEAGMVGTRKLARLLEHAGQAEAKVILVGDDRQLSSIDAGGGFRGLRLRLGASELTQNRRQQAEWEQRALELVRRFQVEQAVSLYREHDRVVVAETKDELTRGLLEDWRQAFQQGQDVVILAHRREDVGQFNLACQQLRTDAGELDPDARLQVADRSLAVSDRVVCGKNALKRLGVANGTRGTVVALDREARSLTIQIGDNTDAAGRGAAKGETVTLPASYLDGKSRPGAPRRVDLAYATTGHKSQGLTKWTSLPFVSGREDAQWLYVVLSRAKHRTRIYTVTGPEERPPELSEVPDNRLAPDGYERLAAAMGRDRAEQLASDARRLVDLRAMPTRELRAERDRLDDALATAPRDRHHEADRAATRHTEREQRVRELKAAGTGGPEPATAIKLADQAGEQARQLRQHQQQRAAWLETHADLVAEQRAVMRELGWRRSRGRPRDRAGPAGRSGGRLRADADRAQGAGGMARGGRPGRWLPARLGHRQARDGEA